jgi:hypothetical protein
MARAFEDPLQVGEAVGGENSMRRLQGRRSGNASRGMRKLILTGRFILVKDGVAGLVRNLVALADTYSGQQKSG